jgi:multimeric flavodoxin WrbA
MNAVIMDGSPAGDRMGERAGEALRAELAARGWDAETFVMREQTIGNCAGDFFCWVRSPGLCNVNDDNRIIAAAIARSDLLIYLTPVTFGAYSSDLKRMVDHQIQNISPHFTKIDGETHHKPRYERYPDLLVVGWQAQPDAEEAAVFRFLVARNSINFYAPAHVVGMVAAGEDQAALRRHAIDWLDAVGDGRSTAGGPPPAAPAATGPIAPPRRALLLVGSPKTRKSASYALGSYLYEQLAASGLETETIFIHTSLGSAARRRALLDAVRAADLVTLAFPLYVDSFPAPVIDALEQIAADRAENRPAKAQRFVALANSGFPEVAHSEPALAAAGVFARQTGFEWAGSLALGGGGVVGGDRTLVEMGGRTAGIRQGLDLAAAALAAGEPVPPEAAKRLARPVIPHWLYRQMGEMGWRQLSKEYETEGRLDVRPYTE